MVLSFCCYRVLALIQTARHALSERDLQLLLWNFVEEVGVMGRESL